MRQPPVITKSHHKLSVVITNYHQSYPLELLTGSSAFYERLDL